MRGLITLTFLLAFAWSAWWFIGTNAQKSAIETWMEQRRDAGWVAEVEDESTKRSPIWFGGEALLAA